MIILITLRNESANTEDEGHKWTLGALLRKLHNNGVDTSCMFLTVNPCLEFLFSCGSLGSRASVMFKKNGNDFQGFKN